MRLFLKKRKGVAHVYPFPFLNHHPATHVTPKPYACPDFYEQVIALSRDTFAWCAILPRCRATTGLIPRWMNLVRTAITRHWLTTPHWLHTVTAAQYVQDSRGSPHLAVQNCTPVVYLWPCG
jgi:hypothetical protein